MPTNESKRVPLASKECLMQYDPKSLKKAFANLHARMKEMPILVEYGRPCLDGLSAADRLRRFTMVDSSNLAGTVTSVVFEKDGLYGDFTPCKNWEFDLNTLAFAMRSTTRPMISGKEEILSIISFDLVERSTVSDWTGSVLDIQPPLSLRAPKYLNEGPNCLSPNPETRSRIINTDRPATGASKKHVVAVEHLARLRSLLYYLPFGFLFDREPPGSTAYVCRQYLTWLTLEQGDLHTRLEMEGDVVTCSVTVGNSTTEQARVANLGDAKSALALMTQDFIHRSYVCIGKSELASIQSYLDRTLAPLLYDTSALLRAFEDGLIGSMDTFSSDHLSKNRVGNLIESIGAVMDRFYDANDPTFKEVRCLEGRVFTDKTLSKLKKKRAVDYANYLLLKTQTLF